MTAKIARVVLFLSASALFAQTQTVDDLIATCPTAAEIAAIDKDVKMTFAADPTASAGFVCRAADGSADLTRLQERSYQMMRVFKRISFAYPLPWTSKPIYDWLVGAVGGIFFDGNNSDKGCCMSGKVIHIGMKDSGAYYSNRWIEPETYFGLFGLAQVVVHEARHADGGPGHVNAAGNDLFLGDMGSWSAVYYFSEWTAFYSTKDGFFTPSDIEWMGKWSVLIRRSRLESTGDGIAVAPSPEKNFGTETVGIAGPLQTVAVTSTTPTAYTVSRVEIIGNNANDFQIEKNTCIGSSTIPSCVIVMRFKPSAAGTRTAMLAVYDSAPASSHTTTLTGVGKADFEVAVKMVLNIASYAPQANEIAGGEIVSIFGTNLATSTASAASMPLPTTLAGARVFIDGKEAPLFLASPGQLNALVPWELAYDNQHRPPIVVEVLGQDGQWISSAPYASASTPAQPAIFSSNQEGPGQGAVLIAGTPYMAAPARMFPDSRPVKPGEYIEIYATGLGKVTNAPNTGLSASAKPLSETVLLPTVEIGGVSSRVVFSGLAPGFVGLYQVNAQVPPGTPSGSAVTLTISTGGKVSNTVTIAIE